MEGDIPLHISCSVSSKAASDYLTYDLKLLMISSYSQGTHLDNDDDADFEDQSVARKQQVKQVHMTSCYTRCLYW